MYAFWFVSYFIYFLFTFLLFIYSCNLFSIWGKELQRLEKSKKNLTKTVQTKYDALGVKRLSIIISAV